MAEEKIRRVRNLDIILLFQAIDAGLENDAIIKYVKESDSPELIKDKNGNGLLHWCIRNDKLQLMSDLLALGKLPINGMNFYSSPLCYSLREEKNEFAVKLIEAGADVNIYNIMGTVLLHLDISLEGTRLLVENGATATINKCDFYGRTPLHNAVCDEDLERIHLLLYYGAEADNVCNLGYSPFMVSLGYENTETQEILLEYECDFNRMSKDNRCIVELAIRTESPYILEIMNRGADIKTCDVFKWCLDTDNFESFKAFWKKKAFLTEYYDCSVLFAVTDRIKYISYFEYILETDELKVAVQHLPTENLITQVLHLTKQGYSRQLAQKAAYILLSCGVCLSRSDLFYIYYNYKTEEYEMDEFFRVILFMDVEQIVPEKGCILLSIVFLTSTNIYNIIEFHMDRISQDTFRRYQVEIQEVTRHFVHPKLRQVVLHHAKEGNPFIDENVRKKLTNNFPSLLELARNQVRHFIHSNFKIRNACQFYTILERLPLPILLIEVTEFRRSIY